MALLKASAATYTLPPREKIVNGADQWRRQAVLGMCLNKMCSNLPNGRPHLQPQYRELAECIVADAVSDRLHA